MNNLGDRVREKSNQKGEQSGCVWCEREKVTRKVNNLGEQGARGNQNNLGVCGARGKK